MTKLFFIFLIILGLTSPGFIYSADADNSSQPITALIVIDMQDFSLTITMMIFMQMQIGRG